MLRGYRNIILAFGLILAGAQQPAKKEQDGTGASQQRTASAQTAAPSPTAESPYRPYPGYDPDPCYRAEHHDSADLCAQWRAAVAAEKTAQEARRATTWAIVATFLSLATVIGLTITIWQTHGALDEARRGNRLNLAFERRSRREGRLNAAVQERALAIADKNADAADRAVAESQRIGEAQVRCYLNITKCAVVYKGDTWLVGCTVENTGQSPALLVDWGPTLTTYVREKGTLRYSSATDVGGTMHYDIPAKSGAEDLAPRNIVIPFDTDEIQAFEDGNEVFIQLTAKVSGIDVFNKPVTHDAIFVYTFGCMPEVGSYFELRRGSKVRRADEQVAT